MTRIIMISRDIKMLEKQSDVFLRAMEYSSLFDELNVVVMANYSSVRSFRVGRLFVYNATSYIKFISLIKTFFKTLYISNKIKSGGSWITSQDPFESGLVALIISRLSNVKLQIQIHTDCFNPLYVNHSIKNRLRNLIAKIIITKADEIRVVSDKIKESINELGLNITPKIDVLPIWTDISKIKQSRVNDMYNLREKFSQFKKILLIVARLESEKNIELSLISFKKLLRFRDDIGLVIAGNGNEESWLKKMVIQLDIQDKVKFIGFVPDVPSLMKTSDLLLVTSFYEGYGLNIVESVACECPVVATNVGVAKRIGATIVPYDPGIIAIKLNEVLDNYNKPILSNEFNVSKEIYLNKYKNTFK